MKKLTNFIDGAFLEPQSGKWLESFNPAIGEAHIQVADSNASDVDAAVAAAKRAFPKWSATSVGERSRVLYRIAELVDAKKRELAEAESRDQGKPVWLAETMDMARVASNFRFFAGAALHAQDRVMKTEAGAMSYVSRKPVGVAGLISPWNLPLYLLSWKIAPAIAFGNTTVCKPSEFTSLTAHMLCEILNEAGLPKGVVNIVFGTGASAGAALVAHEEVPLISFTGGTATGKAIAAVAAPMFKKVSLELGGKNPNLIFDDADLQSAVKVSLRSSFLNQGEICLCGSRIYVQEGIYDRFVESFVAKARELKVGDPTEKTTFMGPLVSRAHLDKVESFLTLAKEEGVKVLCGGAKPKLSGALAKGYFLEPTVLEAPKATSRIQQEEIFGPVVSISKFKSEEEAIELANGTKYGLSATVWTESLKRAHRVAEKLDAGTVWVNTWLLRDLRAPFGGVKASGVGREGQEESREFFTEAKTICIQHE